MTEIAVMKVFNIIFIVLFIVAAVLQYNDPDPYLWIPIYGYAAILCFLALTKNYKPLLFRIGLIFYSCYAVYLLIDKTGVLSWANEHEAESIVQSMKASKPWIEETREFFGLLIIITVVVANMIWLSAKKIKTA